MALTQKDHILMTQRLLGATVESAAQEAGMKVRTAYRRISTPEYRQEYQRMVEISFLSATGIVCGLAPRAAKKLAELLDSKSDQPGDRAHNPQSRFKVSAGVRLEDPT